MVTISLRSCRVNGVEHADAEMKAYYDQGNERDRLAAPKGVLEFVRTQEIVLRRLPAAPAVVADIGGGPGRYAVWLAELGYEVEHRDVMDLHVEQLKSLATGWSAPLSATPGAWTCLTLRSMPSSSWDPCITCANGPIGSGLFAKPAASSAIADPIFIATISRWAARLDGVLQQRLYEHVPDVLSLLPESERTGNLPPVVPGGFLGYTHRPDDLVDEIAESGLQLHDLVGVEGCRSPATTWRSASRTPRPGTLYSMPHAPSNTCPNYSGSAHTCLPRLPPPTERRARAHAADRSWPRCERGRAGRTIMPRGRAIVVVRIS